MKKATWRILLASISVAYIIFLWIRKDIVSIYASMPMDRAIPLIATTIAVTLLKVAAISAVVLFIKGIIHKRIK